MKILILIIIVWAFAILYLSGCWIILKKYGKKEAGINIKHQAEIYRRKLCDALKNSK